MFERFTDRARRVVVLAQEEARALNHDHVGTEHILLGLAREEEGLAARALGTLGISPGRIRREVHEIVGSGTSSPPGDHIPFSPRAKEVLELSLREALQLGHDYIGTEHILLGLIREGEGVAAQVLQELGADLDRVRGAVLLLLSRYTGGSEATPSGGSAEHHVEEERGSPLGAELAGNEPTCRRCAFPLSETLAVKAIEVLGEQGPTEVRIAYCGRCGTAIGTTP